MFDPSKIKEKKNEQALKKRQTEALKEKFLHLIPLELQNDIMIDIKEVVCGDPSCSPIDTVVTIVWESGGRGVFALPLAIAEIEDHEIIDLFPDIDTLEAWKAGQKVRWPREPELRFTLGTRVQCRIGPDPVTGWASGRVVALHYSEPNWPPGQVAPYQIWLHDGRLIFAPADTDQLIRERPPPDEDSPPSPPMPEDLLQDDGDYDDDGYQ